MGVTLGLAGARASTAPRHHKAKPSRIAVLLARGIAGTPVEGTADGRTYILLELGFSHPGVLELQLIEDRIVGLRHDRRRTDLAPWPVRHA